MRASHFANFVVALTTFVATYQLFNGEQQHPTLRANQLENIQASVRTKKSDRLALKEEDQEEVEDQAFSPKPVRLEKYDLPTDNDLNSRSTRQETNRYRSRFAKGHSRRSTY